MLFQWSTVCERKWRSGYGVTGKARRKMTIGGRGRGRSVAWLLRPFRQRHSWVMMYKKFKYTGRTKEVGVLIPCGVGLERLSSGATA
ncbi:hypothetical protein CASFOL_012166 [Castilleja foliolosa]|uniref:Uncharacterized protein n=1 Tax=Castilleja foliolosa TaxID=1961234 RepID=A0ABD3DQT5_9LAMI